MFQLQILAVLLSLVLFYILFSGFSVNDLDYKFCARTQGSDHHLTFKKTSCEHSRHCCGDTGINLRCLFRFKGDDHPVYNCFEYEIHELSCEHNRTVLRFNTLLEQELYFYVEPDSIDYGTQTFRVIDPGLQNNNCSSLPLFPLRIFYGFDYGRFITGAMSIDDQNTDVLIFVSCKKPVNSESKSHLYVDTASCNITANSFSNNHYNFSLDNSSSSYSYVVVGKNLSASDIEESCTILEMVPAQIQSLPSITTNISYQDIHNLLADGFQLRWDTAMRQRNSFMCHSISILYNLYFEVHTYLRNISPQFKTAVRLGVKLLIIVIAARNVIGLLLLLAFLIYKWQRRHLSMYDAIEEFLQTNNGLMPIRYSYKEIKAMTINFKEKLGEGGYGLVYKGKLRSGDVVAVKMLNKSKANGQEFINEVATIGRIHHVNVVRLVGFCVTISKRALVYDYMPNGSLDKFIFSDSSNGGPLSWKKANEIAMGIARGIEYLHQGCNMQILHFDIKPHNILLDENFVPKVSDFGLAKLYPIQNSVATLTAVRGTFGYMAPELFYKRVGRVSNKADVYSYGMVLMEMAGRRRNVNAHAEHSSQIYHPSWIYEKFYQGEDMEIGDHATEEEKIITRKLILIALWCIQMTPEDRPSMREVKEMLEGDLRSLKLPPKPSFYPPNSPIVTERSSPSFSNESAEPLCNSVALEIEFMDD